MTDYSVRTKGHSKSCVMAPGRLVSIGRTKGTDFCFFFDCSTLSKVACVVANAGPFIVVSSHQLPQNGWVEIDHPRLPEPARLGLGESRTLEPGMAFTVSVVLEGWSGQPISLTFNPGLRPSSSEDPTTTRVRIPLNSPLHEQERWILAVNSIALAAATVGPGERVTGRLAMTVFLPAVANGGNSNNSWNDALKTARARLGLPLGSAPMTVLEAARLQNLIVPAILAQLERLPKDS